MTLKNNNIIFPYFFRVFFPITPKIRASDKNGFQIRILHRKLHQLKEKNILFYMTLNDNNTTSIYVAIHITAIFWGRKIFDFKNLIQDWIFLKFQINIFKMSNKCFS